jgi:zinc transport system substrate-binding protein
LQHHYGINGQSVHWEPDQEPTTSAWIALQQIMAAHSATIMIWEGEALISTAQRLSDVGITSVHFHTVANRPEQGDYLSVMRANMKRIASSL